MSAMTDPGGTHASRDPHSTLQLDGLEEVACFLTSSDLAAIRALLAGHRDAI